VAMLWSVYLYWVFVLGLGATERLLIVVIMLLEHNTMLWQRQALTHVMKLTMFTIFVFYSCKGVEKS
jgi:hypothetical protein